jgi:chromosome segregation ATPase
MKAFIRKWLGVDEMVEQSSKQCAASIASLRKDMESSSNGDSEASTEVAEVQEVLESLKSDLLEIEGRLEDLEENASFVADFDSATHVDEMLYDFKQKLSDIFSDL